MPKRLREVATTYGRTASGDVAAPLFTRYRVSVKAFHDLHEAGDLTEDDRVELLDGEMIMMSPIGTKHFACVNRITRFFFEKIGQRAIVSVQGPVRLDDYNEPQPDIALLYPRQDDYAGGLPQASDTFLVVEVSDSTLEYDREIKLKAYARAGIPEAWIVNLVESWVEVYREPDANGYRLMRRHAAGESFGPAAFVDVAINPTDVLI
jgi:Uma2 family endonuclease